MPETAIIETGNQVTAKCAFCNGTGKDPFGLLSILATCQVCRGSGKITVTAPVVKRPFCNGSGVHPSAGTPASSAMARGLSPLPLRRKERAAPSAEVVASLVFIGISRVSNVKERAS